MSGTELEKGHVTSTGQGGGISSHLLSASDSSSSGASQYERHGHTGESPAQGH